MRITQRYRTRPVMRTRVARVPQLFGGPRGGRRPMYLHEVALGDDIAATFNASVEQWRSDVEAQMGTNPINFLLAWIQKESNGNPCSWTSLRESGIYQLMYPDNLRQGDTTEAQQHPVPPCVAGTQTTAYRSSLTDDQAYEQVRGGINYVNYCRTVADAYLGQYGYAGRPGWTTDDWSYWAMVKMVHVAPAKIPGMLAAGMQSGSVPADWDVMMGYVTGIPASWTDNARWVGMYGQGGGTVFNKQYIIYGAMAIGAVVLVTLMKRQSRRISV